MSEDGQARRNRPGRVLVAQIGARMHYAVPRIFEEAGILGALHTDICAVKGWPRLLSLVPASVRSPGMKRLAARVPRGISLQRIRTENDIGLKYAMWLRRSRGATEQTKAHLWAAEEFCRRVVRRGLREFDQVYVFTSDGLEILEETRRAGIPSIVEQTIPPREIVMDMFQREYDAFPDLVGQESLDGLWRELSAREKSEWEAADLILCGSQFVLDGIREVGGPVEKSIVVNYGVDGFPSMVRRPKKARGQKTNVLFVGEVGFRKGAHYLIEAARRLKDPFHFRFCGRVVLPERFLGTAPENVEVLGIVPRSEMPSHYEWADVFCLPSLLEGSATVTYEAMAARLPIVTTPNAGSLVRDRVDGFLIPPRDVDALTAALEECRRSEFTCDQSPPTDRPGGPPTYTIEAYKERLLRALVEPIPQNSGVTS